MKTADDVHAALPKELIFSVTPSKGEPPKATMGDIVGILSAPDPKPVRAILEPALMVHSTALYPNGDTISVYVVEASDGLYLTEAGTTLYNFNVGGLACTTRLVDIIRGICVNVGVDFNGSEEDGLFCPTSIGIKSTKASFLADFLKLVEAVAKASTIGYFEKEFSRDRERKDS